MRIQRHKNTQPRRTPVLIQCEGRVTERIYLDGLCRREEVATRFTVTVKGGGGGSAETIVKAAVEAKRVAKERGEEYDAVFCVLDVEGPDKRDALDRAVEKAARTGVTLFLSNPSFEVWLIAHFERTSKGFVDSAAAEKHLEAQHWRREFHCEYDKADPRLYERLETRLDAAVENAANVLEKDHSDAPCRDANSSTEVYRLVLRLRDPEHPDAPKPRPPRR